MIVSFDWDEAKEHGVVCAILMEHLRRFPQTNLDDIVRFYEPIIHFTEIKMAYDLIKNQVKSEKKIRSIYNTPNKVIRKSIHAGKGYLYLACAMDENGKNLTKIGYSGDPSRRIKEISKKINTEASIFHVIQTDQMSQVELFFHTLFSAENVPRDKAFGGTEWFYLPNEILWRLERVNNLNCEANGLWQGNINQVYCEGDNANFLERLYHYTGKEWPTIDFNWLAFIDCVIQKRISLGNFLWGAKTVRLNSQFNTVVFSFSEDSSFHKDQCEKHRDYLEGILADYFQTPMIHLSLIYESDSNKPAISLGGV